jgi:hypothetical protein
MPQVGYISCASTTVFELIKQQYANFPDLYAVPHLTLLTS